MSSAVPVPIVLLQFRSSYPLRNAGTSTRRFRILEYKNACGRQRKRLRPVHHKLYSRLDTSANVRIARYGILWYILFCGAPEKDRGRCPKACSRRGSRQQCAAAGTEGRRLTVPGVLDAPVQLQKISALYEAVFCALSCGQADSHREQKEQSGYSDFYRWERERTSIS